jgi:hypothetical protein
MKARLGIALAFFLVAALLLFVNISSRANANPRTHAAHACSTKTTVGRYFVICNGFLSPGPNTPLLPAKLLGTLNADDNGTFTGTSTVMIGGGPPLTQAVVGTENLNSDCNGTITYDQKINGQQGPPLDITFFVSDEGDRLDGLVVDPGTVFSCELRRVSKAE